MSTLKKLNSFLYELDAELFIRFFRKSLVFYAMIHYFLFDWTLYDVAKELFQPVGLGVFLLKTLPELHQLYVLKLVMIVFGIMSLKDYHYKLTTFVFACIALLFDYFHNMYGFINAEIHLVYFLFLISIYDKKQETSSFIFRFCELIVVLLYFQSGIAKLQSSGIAWAVEGTTLQIGWLRQGLELGQLLSNSNELARFASIGALIFELSFGIYYFLSERLRIGLLGISVLFHLTTFVTMGIDFSHLWIFQGSFIIFLFRHRRRVNRALTT